MLNLCVEDRALLKEALCQYYLNITSNMVKFNDILNEEQTVNLEYQANRLLHLVDVVDGKEYI